VITTEILQEYEHSCSLFSLLESVADPNLKESEGFGRIRIKKSSNSDPDTGTAIKLK
jgi:hypothetical protein